MLEAVASGASTDEALLERFDDLHLLRELVVEGFVREERMPQVVESSVDRLAVEPTSFYSLTERGRAALEPE